MFLMKLSWAVHYVECKVFNFTLNFTQCNICSYFCIKVVNENEGYLHLMDDDGNVREDLKVPEGDLGKEIQAKLMNDEEFMVRLIYSPQDLIKHATAI